MAVPMYEWPEKLTKKWLQMVEELINTMVRDMLHFLVEEQGMHPYLATLYARLQLFRLLTTVAAQADQELETRAIEALRKFMEATDYEREPP